MEMWSQTVHYRGTQTSPCDLSRRVRGLPKAKIRSGQRMKKERERAWSPRGAGQE